jgi:hypothetical protein
MAALHNTTSQAMQTPLKRTDNSTWVDGASITDYCNPHSKAPQFQPKTPAPNRPTAGSINTPTQATSFKASAARVVGTMKVPTNRPANDSIGAQTASTNRQALPTLAQSQGGLTPSTTPQDPRRVTNSGHTTPPNSSRRPDISKDPGNARNVASNDLPSHHRHRTSQQSGQTAKPSHVGSNKQQMPTSATATITGHGDRHIVNRSQVIANARSVQSAPHKRGMCHLVSCNLN